MGEPRYMTLAEAQAIECNRCGDCCDSRRVGFTFSGQIAWTWGKRVDGMDGLIIPLREALPLMLEDDHSLRPAAPVGAFRCAAFVATGDGVTSLGGDCARHGDPALPSICSGYPVFGAYAGTIARTVQRDGEFAIPVPGAAGSRCSWADVVIVADVYDAFVNRDGWYVPVENKDDSFGWLGGDAGHLVAVDYGD